MPYATLRRHTDAAAIDAKMPPPPVDAATLYFDIYFYFDIHYYDTPFSPFSSSRH